MLADPDRFRYVRPDEPLVRLQGQRRSATWPSSNGTSSTPGQLAVIDGVTEAMTTEGLSILDNTDVAIWQRRLPKRIAATGAAVVCVDHVTKNAVAGRFAIGGQHKLAGVTGATYKFTVTKRLRRALSDPTTGRVTITVEKDRPGWVRARAEGDDDTIAVLEVTAYPDGGGDRRAARPGRRRHRPRVGAARPDPRARRHLRRRLQERHRDERRGTRRGSPGRAALARPAEMGQRHARSDGRTGTRSPTWAATDSRTGRTHDRARVRSSSPCRSSIRPK